MLLQAVSRLGMVSRQVLQHARRNIGVSAVAAQKAAPVTDPIQQLFLDKIKDYKTKSVGGKLVDVTPQVESALKDELDKVDRVYSAAGKDMTQFPSFSFTDPQLESAGLGDTKDLDIVEAEETIEEVEEDNKPYFVLT
ncbi:ATP synthase-coupling factor 6, mitochondrial-like isoform X2 [Littorina saxatilis]